MVLHAIGHLDLRAEPQDVLLHAIFAVVVIVLGRHELLPAPFECTPAVLDLDTQHEQRLFELTQFIAEL